MRIPGYNKLVTSLFYRRFLGMSIGSGARVGKIFVANPKSIRIGEECSVEDRVVFNNHGIQNRIAEIHIGSKCFIGRDTIFNSCFGVYIGEGSMIAARCQFIDHDHGFVSRKITMANQLAHGASIHIGSDVWVGAGAIILKSVNVGVGAIVGAGSVVTKNIPAWEIWAGNPAKKIGVRP